VGYRLFTEYAQESTRIRPHHQDRTELKITLEQGKRECPWIGKALRSIISGSGVRNPDGALQRPALNAVTRVMRLFN
jgi:hypothetical protein